MEQYSRNMGIMNDEEFSLISKTNVLIIGVGGLGGYIASGLARFGVMNITIIDNDSFDMSNLNRQIFATTKTLNLAKVDVVKVKLLDINPKINIKTHKMRFTDFVDKTLFENIDIVFDAVDSIKTKLLIEKHCSLHNKPLIHGAIAGWYGQVGIILPNSDMLKDIYKDKTKGTEDILKSPTFIPGIVGNLMVSEFIKFILDKDSLINQILYIDVLDHEYKIIYKK